MLETSDTLNKRTKRTIDIVSPLETTELLTPHIDLCSDKEALVDGCLGIIEYNSETVRLNCRNKIVKFSGTDLSIMADTIEHITVSGNILSLEFCSL